MTALKTLTLRLRGAKTELEEAGLDAEDMVTTTSALQKKLLALTGGRVDIMSDADTFKNTTEILREMSEVWDSLSDKDAAAALELMGGKRQANILSAIIQNFDMVDDAIKASSNASGSALKENEVWLDSIEGKISQFNNTIQSMWNNSLDSDWVKGFVEFGTVVFKAVDNIGMLRTALIGLAVVLNKKYQVIDLKHPITSFKQLFSKNNLISVNKMRQNLEGLEKTWKNAEAAFKDDPTEKNRKTLEESKKIYDEYNLATEKTIQLDNDLLSAKQDLAKAEENFKIAQANNYHLEKFQNEVDKAKLRVKELEAAQKSNAQAGTSGWKKLGNGAKAFGKQVASALTQMLVMVAISKVIELGINLADRLFESAEEAAEAFDELRNALEDTKNELKDLETELDDVNKQIEELYDQGALSFTDKEQLALLKAQSEELERQIVLKAQLAQQQQQGVNSGVVEQAKYYRNTGKNTGKTTGQLVGSGATIGLATGGAVGASILSSAAAGAAAAGTAMSWNPVGWALLAVAALTAVGAAVGGIIGATEDKVGDSLDNMQEKYSDLQQKYHEAQTKYHQDPTNGNKKKFDKAQTAFIDYQSEMAKYISELDAYYSSIDLEAETDPERIEQLHKEMNEFYDTQDKWAITSGDKSAKTNALNRIFGENAEKELKDVKKKAIEALNSGEEINIENIFEDKEAFNSFKARMYDMGIYITDVIDYLKDYKETSDSAFETDSLMDVVKGVNRVKGALEGLNSAIEEVNENGIISTDTIMSLQEIFGSVEGVADEWDNFINIMMSGTASTLELTEATRQLTEAWLDEQLIDWPMNAAEKMATAAQLSKLGVKNSLEYIEDANAESGYKKITDTIISKTARKEELANKLGNITNPLVLTDEQLADKNELDQLNSDFNDLTNADWIKEITKEYGISNAQVKKHIDLLNQQAQKQHELNELNSKTAKAESLQVEIDKIAEIEAAYNNLDIKYGDREWDNAFQQNYSAEEAYELTSPEWRANIDKDQFIKDYNAVKALYDTNGELKGLIAKKKELETELSELNINPEVSEETKQKLQSEIDSINQQIEAGITGKTELELELEVTLGSVGTTFDTYTSKMETLASIQSAVADGFIISAEKAREFAAVYPEILKNATTTANGQIALNADVVNAFLSGERAELDATIDTEIGKLEAQKASLEAKMTYTQTQLEMAKALAEGETSITKAEFEWKINAGNAMTQAMIDMGIEESRAYAMAAAAMAGDVNEFNRIAAEVCTDVDGNFDKAAYQVAQNIYNNMQNAQGSVAAFATQCHEAAKAMAGVASGQVQGSSDIVGGGSGGTSGGGITVTLHEGTFEGSNYTYTPKEFSLADYISELEINLSESADAIAQIDGQIELLKAQKNRKLESFDPERDSSLGGSDDSNGNGVDDSDEFQQAMDYWENRIAANQAKYEQVQNEIDMLEAKGKRAGEGYYKKQIELERDRQQLLEGQKDEAYEYLKTLKEGSEEWWNTAKTINDIEGELDDVIANVQELNDAIAQIHWDTFEEVHDRYSDLTTDLENIRDILSSKDMFDDQGNWTEDGVATLATYLQEIEIYKNALTDVQKDLKNFQKGYEGNENAFRDQYGIDSEQEYYDKLVELQEQQDEYVKAVNDSEQSVVEMYENQIDAVEEYINELVDGYNDYIDVCKEALDAERDLYEFKKSTSEKTKNIAELERRIASLSGSDNAADIAERRRLQAELTDAKSDLDDHYYSHAKDSQQQALDEEAVAYEESMNNYIEGLRTTLDEAQLEMGLFLDNVTTVVMMNAATIEQKYHETGLAIGKDLTNPWAKAAQAMKGYEIDALGLMNSWLSDKGFFTTFKNNATDKLKAPWSAGKSAANSFKNDVKIAMNDIYTSVKSNVENSVAQLNKLAVEIKKINDTTVRPKVYDSGNSGNTGSNNSSNNSSNSSGGKKFTAVAYDDGGKKIEAKTNYNCNATLNAMGTHIGATATSTGKTTAATLAKNKVKSQALWYAKTKQSMTDAEAQRHWNNQWSKDVKYTYYAKGTIGTKKDEYAITDEPWLGDELTMYATKQGTLSYMRAGSTVIPADLTKELIALGEIGVDGLTMPKFDSGMNVMTNVVNKPEVNYAFDSLLHIDNCTEEVLPKVQKLITKQLDEFARKMNYSLRKIGAT